MGKEGNVVEFSLDLPEPMLNLDGADASASLNMDDLKLDAPLNLSGSGRDEAISAGKAGKKADKKAEKKKPEKKPKAPKPKRASPQMPRLPAGAMLPILLNVLSIIILLVITGIMYVFEVPVNAVPDLTLTTYVQSLWLVIGCLLVVAMLEDIRTALILTGIDLAMLATVFPTLWLLLDMPMNPMYFFVIGLIVLLALVALPLNVVKAGKPSPGKQAAAGAAAPVPTGPRTTS
jgi:hypothetical protein